KQQHVSLGLLTYPALMAADILLYNPQLVPVGEDQRQHLELTRNLAERFNYRFGETFVVPEAQILKATAKIFDLQNPGAKMSKSQPSPLGRIDILDDAKTLTKKIKSAVTDDGTEIAYDPEAKPGVSNLLTIYSSLTSRSIDEIVAEYQGKMYGHLKVDLAEVAVGTLNPVRERVLELLEDRAELQAILDRGAEKAGEIADATLRQVYDKIDVLSSLWARSRSTGRSTAHRTCSTPQHGWRTGSMSGSRTGPPTTATSARSSPMTRTGAPAGCVCSGVWC